jgi:small GTP-binding protein
MNRDLVFVLSTYLSPFDCIRLGLTCKALKRRFLHDPVVWRRFIEKHFGVSLSSHKLSSKVFLKRWKKLSASPFRSSSGVVKFAMVGIARAGKTALGKTFADGPKPVLGNYQPTIGADFGLRRIQVDSGRHFKVQLWDLSGNLGYWNVCKNYTRMVNYLLFCFDLSDPKTWEETLVLAEQVTLTQQTVVCVGTKSDIAKVDIAPAAAKLKARLKLSSKPVTFVCSAKDAQSVEKMFVSLLMSSPVSYAEVCASTGVPAAVQYSPAMFNSWLWTGRDPSTGIVRKKNLLFSCC